MNGGTRSWAVIASVALHICLAVLVWWAALHQQAPIKPPEPEPLALELIAGGAAPQPKVEVAPPAPALPSPRVAEAPAEVNLGKQQVEPKHKPKPKAVPKAPVLAVVAPKPVEKAKPKPVEPPKKPAPPAKAEAKPKPQPKAVAKAEPAKKKAADKPAKAKSQGNEADDLLADLGPAGPKPGANKTTQAGAKQGVEGGSSKGIGLVGGYQNKVQAKIRPLVRIPEGISGNPTVIVRVHVLPSLEVGSVTLEKSSGTAAYDNAVIGAIKEAGSMPALLPGMTIDDVRNMTLRFRPQS